MNESYRRTAVDDCTYRSTMALTVGSDAEKGSKGGHCGGGRGKREKYRIIV
jgi:hypothetical protein